MCSKNFGWTVIIVRSLSIISYHGERSLLDMYGVGDLHVCRRCPSRPVLRSEDPSVVISVQIDGLDHSRNTGVVFLILTLRPIYMMCQSTLAAALQSYWQNSIPRVSIQCICALYNKSALLWL